MLKSHLDMIGRNEPITRKAKFWQSYVRALKGTDDMRAPERVTHRPIGLFRPFSEYSEMSSWPHSKSIYDDPIHAVDRIATPGYRYNPVSRETYGYSPRNIYPHHYTPSDRYRPAPHYNPQKAWEDHLDRLAAMDLRYPSRYPSLEPWGRDSKKDDLPTAADIMALARPTALQRASSLPLYDTKKGWNDRFDRLSLLNKQYPSRYPLMLRYGPGLIYNKKDDLPTAADIMALARPSVPREKEVAYNYAGQPIYTRGGIARRPLRELIDPLPSMPMSRITRDPWWYEYPELRPFESPYNYPWITPTPFYLRDSYLSPIKRNYLWDKHPIRPFGYLPAIRKIDRGIKLPRYYPAHVYSY